MSLIVVLGPLLLVVYINENSQCSCVSYNGKSHLQCSGKITFQTGSLSISFSNVKCGPSCSKLYFLLACWFLFVVPLEKVCRGWVLQMANCWPVVGTEGCWAPGSVPGLIAERLFGSG